MNVLTLTLIGLAVVLVVRSAAAMLNALRAGPELDRPVDEDDASLRLRELIQRRQMLLSLIQATRLDEATDKLAADEAQRIISRYEREAIRIMRELDALRGDEADRQRAEDELDRLARETVAGDDQAWVWSEAARARHGGSAPARTPEDAR